MSTPTENWPKPYMLQLHEAAVRDGMIWVEPISEADAKSLRDRMYRMRRRSDTSMAAYIAPEYHLVMIGVWEPGPDGSGRLPIIYNKLPSGDLPKIRSATGEEIAAHVPKPQPPSPPPEIKIGPEALQIKEDEIDNLVDRLRKSAKERGQ